MPDVHVFAFVCGRHTVPKEFMIAGASGSITIPIVAFLVSHADGLLVFDSGFSPIVHDNLRGYFPPDALESRSFHFSPQDEMSSQMRVAGFDPEDVMFVANSHLHYDHCGGNSLFPRATLLVQRAEWNAATTAGANVTGYRPADLQTGQERRILDGEHDVFGDGAVVLVPTPGHTAGHQSLRVRCPRGVAVLAGDACYMAQTLEHGAPPGGVTTTNAGAFEQSLAALRAMRERGDTVFVSHDPDFWAQQPLAPAPLLG
jgi:N-acyl homoserine lactone hydrolase